MAQIANRGVSRSSTPGAAGAAPGSGTAAGPGGAATDARAGTTARNFTPSQRAAALDAALGDPVATGSDTDWARISIFGTGLALGLAVGAGVALLLAPQSGADARDLLLRRSRRLGRRGHDAWDDLREELRMAARRSGKSLRRSATRTAWAAEDALAERSRRRKRRRLESLDC